MAQHQASRSLPPCLMRGPKSPASSGVPVVQWVLWTWGDLCIREVKRGQQDRHCHVDHTPPSAYALLCPHPTPTVLPSGLDLVLGS